MSKNTNSSEKGLVRKALLGISKGDVRALKKFVNEALLSKVRRALNAKEKEIAASLTKSNKN